MCTDNVANLYLLFLKMPLDLISEHVILKNFLGGGMPPDPPRDSMLHMLAF